MKPTLGAILAILVVGCAPSPTSPPPAPAVRVNEPWVTSSVQDDLGLVVANGQTISHVFRLDNPTSRPIRILQARARDPGCSSIDHVPETIPPKGHAELKVSVRAEREPLIKRLVFLVETDCAQGPLWTLDLDVEFMAEVQIVPRIEDEMGMPLPMDTEGSQRFSVLCRRRGDEGLGPPIAVESSEPIQARFLGPATVRTEDGEWIESTRIVEVTLPASSQGGTHRGAFELRWPDGRTSVQPLRWDVRPSLYFSSPGEFRLRTGDPQQILDVSLQSDDHPFRILRVEGEMLAGPVDGVPSERTRSSQRLQLPIDASRLGVGRATTSEITITTDHPRQPSITMSVQVPPRSSGFRPPALSTH